MITAAVYTADGVTEYDDIAAAKSAVGTTWIRASDATPDEMDTIADSFGIHPLTIEDVRNNVRPKTEEFSDYAFTLLKTAELTTGDQSFDEEVRDEAIGLFIGTDWLVTLASTPDDPVDRIWNAVVSENERLLQHGPDFTAYRVMDVIIDEYYDLLDDIEAQIETIEEEVTVATDIETLEGINAIRRDLLSFRKVAWPAREAVGILARGDPTQIRPETEKYYRDIYDHLVQVVDLTETYRDLAAGARDIYLNTVSQSTNEVMKVLTVIATIFLPLTFVVGVYGMNFADSPYNMPELGWTYGYPAVMVGMALLSVGMLAYFRRRGFL